MKRNVMVNIVGDGPHYGQIQHICRELGLPSKTIKSPRGLDIPPGLTVGCFLDSTGAYRFSPPSGHDLAELRGLAWKSPAALTDFADVSYPDQIMVLGCPGSGNAIVGAIVQRLMAIRPKNAAPTPDESTAYLMAFSACLLNDITRELQDLVRSMGAINTSFATLREDTASMVLFSKEKFAGVYGIPLKNRLYEPVHKTHEPCGPKIANHAARGGLAVLAVRNPLDVIVSMAKKLWMQGLDMLASESVFRIIARSILEYFDSYLSSPQAQRITHVRYERLFTDWEDCVRRISPRIYPGISSDEIDQMKTLLLGNLVGIRGYLWKPGSGKYLDFLASRHFELLEELGYMELMRRLDYPFEKGAVGSAPRATLGERPGEPNVLVVNFLLPYGYSKEQVLKLAPEVAPNLYWDDNLMYLANDPEMLRETIDYMQDERRLTVFRGASAD